MTALLIDNYSEPPAQLLGKGDPMTAESPAPAPEPVGIPCPGCGTTLNQVVFTRSAPNQILRVRKCPNGACRRRVRTSERVVCANSPGRGCTPAA